MMLNQQSEKDKMYCRVDILYLFPGETEPPLFIRGGEVSVHTQGTMTPLLNESISEILWQQNKGKKSRVQILKEIWVTSSNREFYPAGKRKGKGKWKQKNSWFPN